MEIRDAAEAAADSGRKDLFHSQFQNQIVDMNYPLATPPTPFRHDFRRLLAWPRPLLAVLLATLAAASRSKNHPLAAQAAFLDDWCVNTIIRIYKMVFLLVNFTLIGHTGSSKRRMPSESENSTRNCVNWRGKSGRAAPKSFDRH